MSKVSAKTIQVAVADLNGILRGKILPIKNAKKLVDLALSAGSDAVKFQMRNLESLYRKKNYQFKRKIMRLKR